MPQTPESVAAKVKEIYELVRKSQTPISVLSLQTTILLGREDWTPKEVEQVGGEVLGLLIRHGWTKAGA
jgi:hypothetical protein